jgi:hypothetical protein
MPKLEFSGQHAGEKVLFVFRRHVINMRKGFYAILICFLLGSVPFLIWQDNINLLWGAPIGFGLGLLIFFYHWIGWYFSVFIVTNERIRQTSQKGLFGKSVIDLNLSKVQNISYNIPGFTGEFLGYGTIVLQTMVGDMIINKVAHCERVYNQLSDAIHQAGGGEGQPETIDNEEENEQN